MKAGSTMTRPAEPTVLPATLSAEVVVPCGWLDRPVALHRIWIHRDGSITTPDHTPDVESDAESVAAALGEQEGHLCAYWRAVPRMVHHSGVGPIVAPPDSTEWSIRLVNMWTQKATWTALSGILASPCHSTLNPVLVLEYARMYQLNGGYPSDPIMHFTYLLSPWTRESGWRRTRVTTPTELNELLDAGVPTDRAASAAALDITGEQARFAVSAFKESGLPPDAVLQLAYAIPPARLVPFLSSLSADQVGMLPGRLAKLKKDLDSMDLTEVNVEEHLAGR